MPPTKSHKSSTVAATHPAPDLSPAYSESEEEEDSVYDSDVASYQNEDDGSEDEFEDQGSSDEDDDLLEKQQREDDSSAASLEILNDIHEFDDSAPRAWNKKQSATNTTMDTTSGNERLPLGCIQTTCRRMMKTRRVHPTELVEFHSIGMMNMTILHTMPMATK